MLQPVDYNDRQHRHYAASRVLPEPMRAAWATAFARRAPQQRPLTCLDLGSGTGRFTPLLAETFGGLAFGVEPSERMRETAEAAPHPASVRYLAGCAESIPLPDGAADLVLMFLSFHHVRDRVAAAREIVRVLAPGGRVLIRSTFSDRMPEIGWHRFFPRARDVELAMFPTTAAVADAFGSQGLTPLALDTVREVFASNLPEYARRLRTRSISTFEHLTETEITEGFARLEAVLAAGESGEVAGDSDLLVLARP